MANVRKALLTIGYAALFACGLIIVGSWRSEHAETQMNPTPVGTRAESTAASQPAASEPMDSVLVIDNQEEVFARALLRLTPSDGKIIARLYSDDPGSELAGIQNINSYDFEMNLQDISNASEISQAIWTSKSLSSQRLDTPYGIFLNAKADKKILQPMDVSVTFKGDAPHVRVIVEGTFWMYDAKDEMAKSAPVMVHVIGSLDATVPAN